jgi:hypothetical protein
MHSQQPIITCAEDIPKFKVWVEHAERGVGGKVWRHPELVTLVWDTEGFIFLIPSEFRPEGFFFSPEYTWVSRSGYYVRSGWEHVLRIIEVSDEEIEEDEAEFLKNELAMRKMASVAHAKKQLQTMRILISRTCVVERNKVVTRLLGKLTLGFWYGSFQLTNQPCLLVQPPSVF